MLYPPICWRDVAPDGPRGALTTKVEHTVERPCVAMCLGKVR